MKILLTNHDFAQYGGTQTWVREMAIALMEKDHEVEVFTFVEGVFKLPCKVHVRQMPTDIDLAIVNHNTCMRILRPFLTCPVIYTQHGPTHQAEQYQIGADHVVAVSQEVQGVLSERGFESTVITNGINLERFYPQEAEFDVLNLCKGIRGSAMVSKACERLGLSCMTVHYKSSPKEDVASLMRRSRVMVGYGRGILEALACGKQAFVFDARGVDAPRGDGWVSNETMADHFAKRNFSGRTEDINYTQEELEKELSSPARFSEAREWAMKHADIRNKARQYLSLVALDRPVHDPDPTAEYEMTEV